jgi:cardiolipin synthase
MHDRFPALPQDADGCETLVERTLDRITGSRRVGGNQIRLLRDATENYPAWLEAIGAARRRIHFENYIVADDDVGRMFAEVLIERARAGVVVRFLHDWLGSFNQAGRAYWSRLRAAGVEVRCYNPPRATAPLGWISRDHRKVITVDGSRGFVSGLCVSSEWVGDPARGKEPWRDTGIEITGPGVAVIDRAFAAVWRRAGGVVPAAEAEEVFADVGRVAVRVLGEDRTRFGTYRADLMMASIAQRILWLTDAYFVATPTYIRGLADACADGVDVRLLVPGSSDIPAVQMMARAQYRPLLDAGIRVFEWNGSMLHAKSAVCDGRWGRVGSTNLNLASWMANYELDVLVEDEDFAAAMEAQFLGDLDRSTEIVLGPGGIHETAARGRVGSKGAGRALAASGLAIGRRVGASFVRRRMLAPVERRGASWFALALLAVAVLVFLFPALVALPLAAALAWISVALLIKAARPDRHDQP